MRAAFYPKLAADGIRKNKKFYLPFMLTCALMAAMLYIIVFLHTSPLLDYLYGGSTMRATLGLGRFVIVVFAGIFLFYTNSFLIRRRKKEFGLYNILGMGKFNIGRIMCWETVMMAVISLAIGLGAGVALSKLAELGMVNVMRGEIDYTFTVSREAILQTGTVFLVIFALLLVNALAQVRLSNPIQLLHSESAGEKPLKVNWFFGFLGLIILAAAYYMAVSIEDPISAILWFFVAVIMVIVATYLIFVSGSVMLCRILQKKKKYYYRANHFVSVSSMAYRMKRNGAGLASICILVTMVLVMISSSSCLYFGEEDMLRTRYPRDIVSTVYLEDNTFLRDENMEILRQAANDIAVSGGADVSDLIDYRCAAVSGLLRDGKLEIDHKALSSLDLSTYGDIVSLYFIPLSDYNRMMKTEETLAEDEVIVCVYRGAASFDTLIIEEKNSYRVAKRVSGFVGNGDAAMIGVSSYFIVVPDIDRAIEPLWSLADARGDRLVRFRWYYGYNTSVEDGKQIELANQLRENWRSFSADGRGGVTGSSTASLTDERQDFYGTFGGMFFIGIMLSVVFVLATVLIIYYKQVSEGYEDQSRFEIMQKVGMTKKDIRSSINSQMLTVFFLPLIAAVLHLAFAFPIVRRILTVFNMNNVGLFLITTGISVLIFAVFYMLIYRVTSNAYYSIVSGGEK